MQIEIYNPTQGQPLPPIKWNFDELKTQLSAALESYKGRVYTDDTITLAKKDRANLNKLAEAIDSKRREMKALYLRPYEEFEAQAKELTAMVKEQSAAIDAQVKAYEEYRKQEKLERIKTELYAPMIGELAGLVPYEKLHNPKWLNATTSMSAVSEEMGRTIDKIFAGLSSIDTLNLDADMRQTVSGVFLKNFDLAAALAERERIEKERAELAKLENARIAAKNGAQCVSDSRGEITPPKAENAAQVNFAADAPKLSSEDKLYTLIFKVEATQAQIAALKTFLTTNGIKYGRA